MRITFVAASIFAITTCACTSILHPINNLPTNTPLPPTSTFTPTVIWFPPTATNTPLPTATYSITPTIEILPSFGTLLSTDDFRNKSQWSLGVNAIGSIALGKEELSLVIKQPKGYLYSLRQDTLLDDFYVEITANPSICRGDDEYGLLLRVSPNLDFYRFGLTCNGKARLDRFLNGIASSPQPPTFYGAVPPGAPSSSRLGVWALGKKMQFYANGEFLFTVNDTVLLNGGMGVFARASSEDAMTVNFSELVIYEGSQ